MLGQNSRRPWEPVVPPARLLIGPADPEFADRFLTDPDARPFPPGPGPADWSGVVVTLPPGWAPDAVLVRTGYMSVPAWVWGCPVPIIALAHDPNLLWHGYRELLPLFDLVLTDAPAVDRLARAGIGHARPACLYGLDRHFLAEVDAPEGDRDIDVLFVGNMSPEVQGERLGWLGRLGRLADRHRVVIASGVFGADYRALLRRSRVCFNRSIRGECNQRVFEAAACGAALLQEADNAEVPLYLEPGTEYARYAAGDLEEVIARLLADEPAWRAVADRAKERARRRGWLELVRSALAACPGEWEAVRDRAARRATDPPRPSLLARVWQAASLAGLDADPDLTADLRAAGRDHELALLAASPAGAEPHLAAAAAGNRVGAAGWASALVDLDRAGEAVELLRTLLADLDANPTLSPEERTSCPYPRRFDHVRVGWERAGWDHPDNRAAEDADKVALLRCRAAALLAERTGELAAFEAAAAARPDLAPVRAALGCALARAGRFDEATGHLRAAVEANPFDAAAADALAAALDDAGRPDEAGCLRADRRLLARAVPRRTHDTTPRAGLPRPAAPPAGAAATTGAPRVSLAWDGEFEEVHSLAAVNRALCAELVARGHDLALVRPSARTVVASKVGLAPALAGRLGRRLDGPADAFVRHRWPPDFTPPGGPAPFVLMPPWEYGRVPRAWVEPILERVDEVWAYSRAVERAYVASGVPAERVKVIPLGVDSDRFRPGLDPLPLTTRKSVKLLFVGGTIRRKGFDVLLTAYRRAFTAHDDVCLVIRDLGAGTFYRGQTDEAEVEKHRADPSAAEVEYLGADLSEVDLPRLFAACDALVHPYRGEGFALPVLEAMACGRPVVVTAGGPTDEFVPPAACWRVPARVAYFPDEQAGGLPTAGRPWWLEPDPDALADILREVVTDAAGRAEQGVAGRRAALGWTWARTAATVEDRVRELRTRTPVRLARRAIPTPVPAVPAGPVTMPAPTAATAETPVVVPATPVGRPRVSLTMIVKNEERNLPDCLGPVRGLFDEVVVVDTGSIDWTREVARRLGARVSVFPWCDSFAAARNAALDRATGDWAFWLDADDRVDDANRAKLAALFGSLGHENAAYVVKCVCVPDGPGRAETAVDHVRLFRRDPAHRWDYRVHEQILPALRKTRTDVRWSGVAVHHVGYVDAALRRRKLDRDLRLLRLEEQDKPGDPFVLFNLGSVYHELGDWAAAAAALSESLRRSHPQDSIVRKLYALLAQCHRRAGDLGKALSACREGREHYPEDAELLFVEGNLLNEAGDRAGAEELFVRLIRSREADHFASVDTGLRGHKARHNLAVIYRDAGRSAEAEAQWRAALVDEPGFVPAHLGLGELALRSRDWVGVERVAADLRGLGPPGAAEAEILLGRGEIDRQEFAAARVRLEAAVDRFPESLPLRVMLTHALLKGGSDPVAAEESLREVLARDPHHAQARQNLEVLLRNQGRWVEGVIDTPNGS
jgi:glycosyltransferase involved in cell wall biosynthesis/predicted Zn-dependent protease